jgi:hypothetical protein
MYVAPLKTLLNEALNLTFDGQYPVPEFRGIHIGLEYPVDQQMYPSVWIDFEDTQPLLRAGIGHLEYVNPSDGVTPVAPFTRWRFTGYVSLTAVALTSLERDRLYDELVRVVAFSNEDGVVGRFKTTIASNDLIAATLNTDKIEARGNAAAPGTPWGTDEIMYEKSLNLELIGEFVPDPATGTLVSLSRIVMIPTEELPGHLTYVPDNGVDLSSGQFSEWH